VAQDAAVYPDGLCRELLKGMSDQVKHDGKIQEGCLGLLPEFEDTEQTLRQCEVIDTYCSGRYRDDLSGQPLVDSLVTEARQKELQYFCAKGVWMKRPKAEARAQTGRQPISVRWVDVNKGDVFIPRCRSRLVARQVMSRPKRGILRLPNAHIGIIEGRVQFGGYRRSTSHRFSVQLTLA